MKVEKWFDGVGGIPSVCMRPSFDLEFGEEIPKTDQGNTMRTNVTKDFVPRLQEICNANSPGSPNFLIWAD